MNVFDAAMAVLVADPNLAVDAIHRAGGDGPPVSVRAIRSSPDRLADAFGTEVIQATDVLTVPIAALPPVCAGDTVAIGADLLTVTHAEQDATGTAWRIHCQR